jgi:dimethylglycine dehydrogenase
MRTHARAVVIGGGVIGCSILYHLAKLGWTDVVLLERSELTSGSTWHAAAGIHGLHDNNNISRLQYYTMRLYDELERETGQSCGIHRPGSLYLACTTDRAHQLRIQKAKARQFDVRFDEVTLSEAAEMHPLLDLKGVILVMHEPDGGHVDPAGVTHAYAAGARQRGAEIHRFTPVIETNARRDGTWDVVTPRATIRADVVVNAAGLWARELAGLAGFDLPLMTLEHQYFVTETIPEIAAFNRELPAVADRDSEYYLRQEGKGLLCGAYEKDARFWAVEGTPLDFGQELLPDDLERIAPNVERAFVRVPVLATAGIKRVINGPMIWSPDTSALLGPIPELKNYYVCCGIIPGFSQSAGLGLQLAQWIVAGEPELDIFAWDVARYGRWAGKSFTMARTFDNYANRFRIHFPGEERESGRPVRTRPAYERQKGMGAVFGLAYGWEHPLFFAPSPEVQVDDFTFERPRWFGAVGEECRALRSGVGVIDVSTFGKYRVEGPGAATWLDRIVANRLPKVGRTALSPVLSRRGGVAGDFTISRLAEDRFWVVGSGAAERVQSRIFNDFLPAAGVRFAPVSEAYAGFNIAGPNARDLLARLTPEDVSSESFPFLSAREFPIARIPSIVVRVSFTGDLGFEIYTSADGQLRLYEAILAAGAELGVRPVGSRALGFLRVEKGYGSWSREYSPENWPHESGLDRLVKIEKPDFLGRDAYLGVRQQPTREAICYLAVEPNGADAWGGEPVFKDGAYAGRITSGGYGFSVARSVAIAYLRPDLVRDGESVDVAILGRPHPATVHARPLFDPDGVRLRA